LQFSDAIYNKKRISESYIMTNLNDTISGGKQKITQNSRTENVYFPIINFGQNTHKEKLK